MIAGSNPLLSSKLQGIWAFIISAQCEGEEKMYNEHEGVQHHSTQWQEWDEESKRWERARFFGIVPERIHYMYIKYLIE